MADNSQKIKDESREGVTTVIDKKDERPTSNVQHRTSNENKPDKQEVN